MKKKKNGYLPYFISALAAFAVGMAVFVFLYAEIFSGGSTPSLSSEEQIVVERVLTTVSAESDRNADVFLSALESDQISLFYFLQLHFTGKSYLFRQRSETAFTADLNHVLSLDLDKGLNEKESSSQSRIRSIETGMRRAGLLTEIPYDEADVTRLIAVSTEDSLAGDDGFSVGIRKLSGSFTAQGEGYRGDLYVDGSLRRQTFRARTDENGQNFSMFWDTREEESGTHRATVLLRSTDGRGTVVTDEQVDIPSPFQLINNYVQKSLVPGYRTDVWYVLDAKEKNAYVNIVGSDGNLEAALYDRFGERIGVNDLPGNSAEVLRGRVQQEDPDIPSEGDANLFYVRVRRSADQEPGTDINYTMVQSKYVAVNSEGKFLSVKSISKDPGETGDDVSDPTVICQNLSGDELIYSRSELTFLPLNGRLLSLALQHKDGEDFVSFFPSFSIDTQEYALVSSRELTSLRLYAVAAEGYAADISAAVYSETREGEDELIEDGVREISLSPSRNEVRLSVTDFDGEEFLYTLYILSGEDTQGYDREVLVNYPDSYSNGLWLMHNLQPSYEFEPYVTGLSWDEVLDAEDFESRSLADGNTYPEWAKEGSPVYDGNAWYAARRDVVAYFLDPRNFMDPVHVFQFEKLTFDPSIHKEEGIAAMTEGTFLAEQESGYTGILLRAGIDAGISPYFLSSRIIQEMGPRGESLLAHGTLPDYEGYFNFYNIGSTPNPDVPNGALINGARYAMWGRNADEKEITPEEEALLLPWDSREKAIVGGAKWIASSYVEIGQDTLYFQKFDVIDNEDRLYQHQYAQNISMAYSEGARYYKAYKSQGMLEFPFVFKIPIYENMPSDFGKWP